MAMFTMFSFFLISGTISMTFGHYLGGVLYPQDSETREVKSLDGIWNFCTSPKSDQEFGFRNKWYQRSLGESASQVIPMPVPSSYNDVTQDKEIRDYVGWVWYDREFFVPKSWMDHRVFLRFGSVHYYASVWVNGVLLLTHEGGHLPFRGEVTRLLKYGIRNRVTVAVNNTLTPDTIPQGKITFKNNTKMFPEGYFEQSFNFDFFNYAGIHRPVYLYTTPKTYIDDITVETNFSAESGNKGATGYIKYLVEYNSTDSELSDVKCTLSLFDKSGFVVAKGSGLTGKIKIDNVRLWWPYLMDPEPAYLYTLQVMLQAGSVTDVYRLPVGIRTVHVSSTQFFINNKPFYFRGFGKHEDSNIRGKGLDYPLVIKDFNLLKWIGANSFRTSHYPYAEEILDRADREGIVIVDESPACTLKGFDVPLLMKHVNVMEELLRRDKNRPSVVMWSVGNEPASYEKKAEYYFSEVVFHTQKLDPSRPVTLVMNSSPRVDQAAKFLDVICVNRYFAWYSDTGRTELIGEQLEHDLTTWHKKFNKPVMITEYGAGTITGLHMDPPFTWSEDYQVELMVESFKGFDLLRQKGFFVGEMIWNFADFATPQETFRPPGCMKGVFTRERQPKEAARLLQWRYWNVANQTCASAVPEEVRQRLLHVYHQMLIS